MDKSCWLAKSRRNLRKDDQQHPLLTRSALLEAEVGTTTARTTKKVLMEIMIWFAGIIFE